MNARPATPPREAPAMPIAARGCRATASRVNISAEQKPGDFIWRSYL